MRTHIWPIGPRPNTATLPPSGTSAYRTACQAVGSTSERNRNCSSGVPSGIFTGPNWACGTRRYSA